MKLAGFIAAVFCLLALMFMQGCSSPAPYRQTPPVIEQGQPALDKEQGGPVSDQQPRTVPGTHQPASPRTTEPVMSHPSPPAVLALLDRAEQQANTGELESAAASLERAIRIDPRNPVLWYHLATVRLSQGEPAQAEQLATKSNSLAAGNAPQQARNWRLIAQSKRQLGKTAEAAAAERRARELDAR